MLGDKMETRAIATLSKQLLISSNRYFVDVLQYNRCLELGEIVKNDFLVGGLHQPHIHLDKNKITTTVKGSARYRYEIETDEQFVLMVVT